MPGAPRAEAVSKRFAANLRRTRNRRGLSQEELADLIGKHRTEVSLMERGGREPRLEALMKLAGALEVDPGELMEGIEWKPSTWVPSRPAPRKPQPPPAFRGGFRVTPENTQGGRQGSA